MSEKKFRSEQARKNYEKAERARASARKRKENSAKAEQTMSGVRGWLKANPAKAAAIALAAVVVIAVLCMVIRAATDPLKGRQDNWLILDVSASSSDPNYQHLADFDIPDGFTRDDYSLYKDGVQQDFFCIAEDENSVVQDVYVTGAKGIDAATYPATILAYGMHKEAGEPRTLTIGDKECTAIYLISDESEWSGEGMAIAHMGFYFETGKNACVSATFRSGTMPFEQLPDEATLLAEAEKILSGLTLVK